MKVNNPNPVRGPQAIRRGDKTGSAKPGQFASLLEDEQAIAPTQALVPAQSVGAILALQEIGDEEGVRRKARARANRLLDRLDELRLGLLAGLLPKDSVAELIGLIQSERPSVNDAQMTEVLDAIELRAQVELAKLEVGEAKLEEGKGRLDALS